MSSVELDKQKLMGVQQRVFHLLESKEFTGAEVLFGLGEALGRMIYEFTDGTWINKREVLIKVCEHMERTVKAGVIANGGNIGE